jgi:hypothetical protein
MDPESFSVSPEVRERIRQNAGNFLMALKVMLVCLVMMRFYKLGQLVNLRQVVAAAKGKKAPASAKASDAGAAGKTEKAAGSASVVKRRAKAA